MKLMALQQLKAHGFIKHTRLSNTMIKFSEPKRPMSVSRTVLLTYLLFRCLPVLDLCDILHSRHVDPEQGRVLQDQLVRRNQERCCWRQLFTMELLFGLWSRLPFSKESNWRPIGRAEPECYSSRFESRPQCRQTRMQNIGTLAVLKQLLQLLELEFFNLY